MDMSNERAIATLSYEEAITELEGLIKRLEAGSVDLAGSIASYERGVALAAHCGQLLEATERKVDRLVLGPRGEVAEHPLQLADEADD